MTFTHHHILLSSRMVEIYLHSPVRLHEQLNRETILYFLPFTSSHSNPCTPTLRHFVMCAPLLMNAKQDGKAVTLSTRIRGHSGSFLLRSTILIEGFYGLSQSLQGDSRIVSRLGHDRSLSITFQIMFLVLFVHLTLHSLAARSGVNWLTDKRNILCMRE
jgi:hypothetical protein